ncbi:glycosyltransferase [Miniphocaeibacter halophilus]|uniref:Glycosyltransferase n=1 Tax=Miniphocaeibacter halophilus TaxID=2931922 RepID=A0AC61MSU7_9FIRM|nr:glycosyltransferase [Miniphocaeibacter halophilus]QQK07286.1 glycosyltransferase [Miniphocaeibacter halophilus]
MKILLATDAYSVIVNGVITSIKNLRRELISMGHDVKILTLSSNRHSYIDYDSNVVYLGSYDISKIYPDARFSLSYTNPLIDSILTWKPDIIHTQSEFTTFSIARKIANKLDIPIIHTYHTLYEEYTHYFSPSERIGKYLAKKFTKRIYHKSTCMVVPTLKTYKVLKKYGIDENIYIVPTGLSMDKFSIKYPKEELELLKEELNLPLKSKILISVGRIGKEKNIEELINYLTKMKFKNIHLLIVGDGPYKNTLANLIKDYNLNNKITFTGLIPNDELNIYYQMADLFVSASTSETQGLTYIESLANGTPILCRDDECLEQTVINNYNGFRYNSFDEFSEKLKLILNNNGLYKNFVENAVISVNENFSSTTFANKILEIYEKYIK